MNFFNTFSAFLTDKNVGEKVSNHAFLICSIPNCIGCAGNSFDNSVYISCQTGKSCLHPHQEACTTRQSFLPKCSDKRCRLPSRSGNSKSGA